MVPRRNPGTRAGVLAATAARYQLEGPGNPMKKLPRVPTATFAAICVLGAVMLAAPRWAGCSVTIWPKDATRLTATSSAGFGWPPPPPGSDCGGGQARYELEVASRLLAWEVCNSSERSGGGPWRSTEGRRTLSDLEFLQVDTAMRQLTLSTKDTCGEDGAVLELQVSTPDGSASYVDSFCACGDDVYVDRIDEVFAAFRTLAREG